MADFDMNDIDRRMKGAHEALLKNFSGLRTGRASTGLIENIPVDAYGSQMPLNQLATVGVPEPRLLTVQVWDKGMVKAVEKAIANSDLGLNPQPDGNLIRVPVPDLSEERRKELAKVAGKYAEEARIAVRNVRRDGMDSVKAQEKGGDISEDEQKRLEDEIQKKTDKWIGEIDDSLGSKEQEITQI